MHSENLEVAASFIQQPVYVGVGPCLDTQPVWRAAGVRGGTTAEARVRGAGRGGVHSAALARRAPVHGQGSPTAPRLRRNPATSRSFLFCFNSMCCLYNFIITYLGQINSLFYFTDWCYYRIRDPGCFSNDKNIFWCHRRLNKSIHVFYCILTVQSFLCFGWLK